MNMMESIKKPIARRYASTPRGTFLRVNANGAWLHTTVLGGPCSNISGGTLAVFIRCHDIHKLFIRVMLSDGRVGYIEQS